jgi:hypothetical protein
MYAIFYGSAEQQALAMASAARIEKKRGKIATHILPRTTVSVLGAVNFFCVFSSVGCLKLLVLSCEECG